MTNHIFYRLIDPIPSEPHDDRLLSLEAKALFADWLSDDVKILITDELFNEIQKNNDPIKRINRLESTYEYDRVTSTPDQLKEITAALEQYFPKVLNDNNRSDMYQVAYSIAGDIAFFLTQDLGLLNKSEAISREFGLRILSPGEFISHLDELVRESEYHPEPLAGAFTVRKTKVSSEDFSSLYNIFRSHNNKEKKNLFESRLRLFIAKPENYEAYICCYKEEKPLALIVKNIIKPGIVEIEMLRVSSAKLSGTVIRYLLRKTVLDSAKDKKVLITVSDKFLRDGVSEALLENGFSKTSEGWVKCNLYQAEQGKHIIEKLEELSVKYTDFSSTFQRINSTLKKGLKSRDKFLLVDVERRLWPAKIIDADIPNYLISIKPHWAQHLFDEEIAKQTIFGANESLSLSNENVYYRRIKSIWPIESPARIVWYVSRGNTYKESMQVRAISILDEVVVGRAKDLFKRFKRLGTYRWDDVLRTASNDPYKHIMALRFSNSELLNRSMDLSTFVDLFSELEGKKPVLQSPQPIGKDTFKEIYRITMGTHWNRSL